MTVPAIFPATVSAQPGPFEIPDMIKIGAFVWKVVESDSVTLEGGCFGSAHYATQTIYLDPKITPQKKCETFVHEVLHAITWQSGLSTRLDRLDKNLDEDLVRAMSPLIYQIIADNFSAKVG